MNLEHELAVALAAADLAGQFIRAPKADTCRYCNYVAACGDHTNAQAETKVADPAFPAFGRLTAHE